MLIATVPDGTYKKKKKEISDDDTEAAVAQFNMVYYCKVLKLKSSDWHDFKLKTFSVYALNLQSFERCCTAELLELWNQ